MHSDLLQLLTLLNTEQFISVAELCYRLQCNNTAVAQGLEQLTTWNITLETKGDGYRLATQVELLDAKIIKTCLQANHQALAANLQILPAVDSTNTYLMQQTHETIEMPQICLAEVQTAARGRRGKSWQSPFAQSICLSILWQFSLSPQQLGSLSLAVGVAVIQALERYGVSQGLSLKWPNDIYWEQRKLVGILIELPKLTSTHCKAVIGIGLNLALPESATQVIEQPWANIAAITATTPQRNKLTGLIVDHVLTSLTQYAERGFAPFKAKWQHYDCTQGNVLNIIYPNQTITGIGRGIDEHGNILVEDNEGKILRFSSGEVSVRVSST